MLKYLVYIGFLFLALNANAQDNCKNSEIYELSLEKLFKNEKHYVIDFDLKIPEFSKESILNSGLFSQTEKALISSEFEQDYFEVPCRALRNKTKQLENRPIGERLVYSSIRFFRPIFLGENKVILIKEALIKRKGIPRIFGGGLAVEWFKKENDTWKLSEIKGIEMY